MKKKKSFIFRLTSVLPLLEYYTEISGSEVLHVRILYVQWLCSNNIVIIVL